MDLAYLQNLYNEVNQIDNSQHTVVCPLCQQEFNPNTGDIEAEQGMDVVPAPGRRGRVDAMPHGKGNGSGG